MAVIPYYAMDNPWTSPSKGETVVDGSPTFLLDDGEAITGCHK